GQLLLRQRSDLLVAVGQQLGRFLLLRGQRAPSLRQLVRARQLLVAAGHLGVALLVGDQLGVAELPLDLGEAALDLCNERFHGRPAMTGSSSTRDRIRIGHAGLPTSANTKIAITITHSRNAVPQRTWIFEYVCTRSGVSSAPAS